ncbi:MAG TPA: DUF1987 domain-containing protein [Bacteroidales bacterium]|nr:DUF1987 domain-containing protein [Bacteroidales bacterium]
MKDLVILTSPETPYFPEVRCYFDSAECRILGESYMEDARKFYHPVVEWIRELLESVGKIRLSVRLIYFNTSTSRTLLQLLKMLALYQQKGSDVQIEWAYPADDPDLKNDIEDLCQEAGIDVLLVPM